MLRKLWHRRALCSVRCFKNGFHQTEQNLGHFIHRDNYGVYGVRKMWHALRRDGIDIGREQTARLMRLAGVSGKGKGGSPITTRKANVPDLRPDLVEREFKA